ncbi:UNVERIFIED_CONTAM: ABC-2 type transport system ATP-binding protein [Acetivibrio alkalicellulosi]
MDYVIKTEGLKKYYKNNKAVDGIDLEVRKGDIVAILGPNGAGKTTTVEILEGLRRPTAGTIYYFGEKVSKIGDSIKERIGVQLQKSTFFSNLKVKEIIDAFRGLYSKKISTKVLIEKFNLESKQNDYIKNLSGGQMQRVALACAIVNDPEVIFLDEPTTGLDPQARRNLWDSIKELKKEGKTIILTTHYMEEAEALADFVFIIDHGNIIAKGIVNDLIQSLNQSTFVTFGISGNIEKFNTESVFGKNIEPINDKYEIKTNDVEKTLAKLFSYSRENSIMIENINIRNPNLEDVFLNLTGRKLRE